MTSNRYFTLDEKIALIKTYADGAGLSQHKLWEKYEVSKGTVAVYNILQRKDEYKYAFQTNANENVKRKLQDESGHTIDETVVSWFVAQRVENIPLWGPLIQEKAWEVAKEISRSPG
jgi:hypothetical protein